MNDVVQTVRERLEAAERELDSVQKRHALEAAEVAGRVYAARVAADDVHRTVLAESARAWAARAAELAQEAGGAGDEVETITVTVFKNDGTVMPVQEVVFRRDRLRREADEARTRAKRLRAYSAPGGVDSATLSRVVDEQSGLPGDV
jgi:hypothetical protein